MIVFNTPGVSGVESAGARMMRQVAERENPRVSAFERRRRLAHVSGRGWRRLAEPAVRAAFGRQRSGRWIEHDTGKLYRAHAPHVPCDMCR